MLGCGGGTVRKEVWGGVWESVWGEWQSVLACGKGCGEVHGSVLGCGAPTPFFPHFPNLLLLACGIGCGEVHGSVLGCGAPTSFFPHFPTSPPSLHSPHLSLHLPLPPPHPNTLSYNTSHTSSHIFPSSPTPQHIFLLSPHPPHLLQVWRNYHVTKFLLQNYSVKANPKTSSSGRELQLLITLTAKNFSQSIVFREVLCNLYLWPLVDYHINMKHC